MSVRTLCCGLLLTAALAVPAVAQAQGTSETRPALPTFYGDTGLWFVPTAETLPKGRWSTSVFRANYDRPQGLTDVSELGLTFDFGLSDRLEAFGSWHLVALARGVRGPFFVPTDVQYGGVEHEHPYQRDGWSKILGGPIYAGLKWNLISQSRGDAMSFAVRAMIKIPTGPKPNGTNDIDGHGDLIVSREFAKMAEFTGTIGGVIRGDPDEFQLSDGMTWGLGTTFPSRGRVRALIEYEGEWVIKDRLLVLTPPLIAADGSIAPISSGLHDPVDVKAGVVFQAHNGMFAHGGVNYSFGTGDRTVGGQAFDHSGWGLDVRLGYNPGGVKVFVPPPPPAPPPPPPPPAPPAPPAPPPPNQNPIAGAITANPPVVPPGGTSQLSVTATDPDKEPLTYRWTAPAGTFSAPNAASTTWTAPNQEGSVPITVTVTDPRGGTSTSTFTMNVVRPPVKTYTFEDVHFDFDKYNLKPEAVKILDDAVVTLRDNPDLRITVEGHCDSIGTTEYNLALGERRANAAREYLVSRGVATSRLETVSYGEERPKADNSTAQGRAMNRRAALVVKIQ